MFSSSTTQALDALISDLERVEQESRRLEAERYNVLFRAVQVVRDEVEAEREAGFISRDRAFEETVAYRSLRAEIAAALHLSELTVAGLLDRATALATQYPSTHEEIRKGAINAQHARVILEAGEVLGLPCLPDLSSAVGDKAAMGADEALERERKRAEYESRVLEYATQTTPHRLRPIAQRIAEEYAAVSLDVRHDREIAYRAVWLTPRENGMAEIGAYLRADHACAIYSRLTEAAKQLQRAEAAHGGESRRTRNEVRADLLTDLLLRGVAPDSTDGSGSDASGSGGAGDGAGAAEVPATHTQTILESVRGTVQVVVQEGTVASKSSAGGFELGPLPVLEGYGPIAHSTAREIAGTSATWNQVITDSSGSAVLRVERYRPSEEIRRFLIARDQHCRFPGCRVPANRCDFDHTFDAAKGGETTTSNLGALCRGHHTIKHHGGWQVRQDAGGTYEWTSPTGRTHIEKPPGTHGNARVARVRFESVKDPPEPAMPF